MAIMEIIGLSKDFGGTPVLTDVSLAIEPGEKAALVGRNGCGKTTLLRIAMGLDDDYKGVVRAAPGARLAYVRQKAPA